MHKNVRTLSTRRHCDLQVTSSWGEAEAPGGQSSSRAAQWYAVSPRSYAVRPRRSQAAGCSSTAVRFVHEATAWWREASRARRRFWRPKLESHFARPRRPFAILALSRTATIPALVSPRFSFLAWPAVSTPLCKQPIAGGADCGNSIHQGTRLANTRLLTSLVNSRCQHSACSRFPVFRAICRLPAPWYVLRMSTNAVTECSL